jgi:hypothetical protein
MNDIINELKYLKQSIGERYKCERDGNEDSESMKLWHKKIAELIKELEEKG